MHEEPAGKKKCKEGWEKRNFGDWSEVVGFLATLIDFPPGWNTKEESKPLSKEAFLIGKNAANALRAGGCSSWDMDTCPDGGRSARCSGSRMVNGAAWSVTEMKSSCTTRPPRSLMMTR